MTQERREVASYTSTNLIVKVPAMTIRT